VTGGGPFLDAIGERAAAALELDQVTRRWPAGSVLFHEGDRADRVFVLRKGRVKVVATEANGTETVLAVRTAGDLVGELAAIDGRPRSATAIALGDVACAVVGAERFRVVLHDEPEAAMALLKLLAERLREAEGRRAEHGAIDAPQRLARRLLELAGDGAAVEGLNQDDLAALIGASRESVAKALQSLRSEGLVRTRRRAIDILDRDALRRLAQR
jgi:CRP-like cAMP-binding protein